ncbi:MAG: NRDE family protein [Verrucomicrobia bacterium]|nr:NRDE family protein [Verrucomicrobiota bacterium]
MCTVTLVARRNGYALGMNRDEKLTRVAGLPPAQHRVAKRDALFPSEPGGGTWIGVNDAGVTFALINWYSVNARVAGHALSRGEIVKAALSAASSSSVNAMFANTPLTSVNPFRLIGVFPARRAVVEWRWNLEQLQRSEHGWQTRAWISSGFDEPGAQQTRGKIFAEALRQKSIGSADWLRRLHRSHAPERGPYCHCMHREDAATVSYTEVIVSLCIATVRYVADAPCSGVPAAVQRLETRP